MLDAKHQTSFGSCNNIKTNFIGFQTLNKYSKLPFDLCLYVTVDHKTSHKVKFFKIEIYTSSE